jgi:hypothetical protein
MNTKSNTPSNTARKSKQSAAGSVREGETGVPHPPGAQASAHKNGTVNTPHSGPSHNAVPHPPGAEASAHKNEGENKLHSGPSHSAVPHPSSERDYSSNTHENASPASHERFNADEEDRHENENGFSNHHGGGAHHGSSHAEHGGGGHHSH